MSIVNKSTNNKFDEDVEKVNSHALLVGMQIGAVTIENNMQVPQKIKMKLLCNPGIPLLGIYSKKRKSLI